MQSSHVNSFLSETTGGTAGFKLLPKIYLGEDKIKVGDEGHGIS